MKGVSDAHRFALPAQEAGGTAHGRPAGPLLTELSRLINYTDGRFYTANTPIRGREGSGTSHKPSSDLFTLLALHSATLSGTQTLTVVW
jgi:hypothetical protein